MFGLGNELKIALGLFQNKKAGKIKPVWEEYKTNPFATSRLGMANQMFFGRMAGAPALEKNIMTNQANMLSGFQRGATDASQFLGAAAGAGGLTNQALTDLQTREAQNKQLMLGNLNQAYEGMIKEGDKGYQSRMQKYLMDIETKNALRQSGISNIFGGIEGIQEAFGNVIGGLTGLPTGGLGKK